MCLLENHGLLRAITEFYSILSAEATDFVPLKYVLMHIA